MLIDELRRFISNNGVKGTDIFVELCAVPDKIPFYEKFGFEANEAQRLKNFIMSSNIKFQFIKENQHDKRTGTAWNPDSCPRRTHYSGYCQLYPVRQGKGCSLTGPQDMEIAKLNVVKK